MASWLYAYLININKMKVTLLLFLILCIIGSCSVHKSKTSVSFVETGGLNLKFILETEPNGYLIVEQFKDTLPFNFSISKKNTKVIKKNSLKKTNKLLYQYNLIYLDSIIQKYPILKDFDTLYAFRNEKVLEYKSHQ